MGMCTPEGFADSQRKLQAAKDSQECYSAEINIERSASSSGVSGELIEGEYVIVDDQKRISGSAFFGMGDQAMDKILKGED